MVGRDGLEGRCMVCGSGRGWKAYHSKERYVQIGSREGYMRTVV